MKVHEANVHDSTPLVPVLDELLAGRNVPRIGNLNGDNGYQNDGNGAYLDSKKINNSISPRKKSPKKLPKKRGNQRKCVEGVFGIGVQCLDLEHTWVRGLEKVTKDVFLKLIAMMFVAVVAEETGETDVYRKPTYFFG